MRGQRQAEGAIGPGDLLDGYRIGDGIPARPSVFLGEGHAQEAEGRHLLDQMVGELVRLVALQRARRYLLVGEVLYRVAEKFVLVGKLEIHGRKASSLRLNSSHS